ncbi:MAG: hypothetical protein JWO29_1570, partial [Arthrobacter sp.]|nr:hypothetical protein [Arthrobacter sp.]
MIGLALHELAKLHDEADAQARAAHEAQKEGKQYVYPFQAAYRHEAFSTGQGNEAWSFDSIDEWYAAYDRGAETGTLRVSGPVFSLELHLQPWSTVVSIKAPSNEKVARLMRFFDVAEADSKLPEPAMPEPPKLPVVVFIGHGRSSDWRDIKDHLQDSHHYTIEAYEVGARAGHSIRDVLSTMLGSSTFALL